MEITEEVVCVVVLCKRGKGDGLLWIGRWLLVQITFLQCVTGLGTLL